MICHKLINYGKRNITVFFCADRHKTPLAGCTIPHSCGIVQPAGRGIGALAALPCAVAPVRVLVLAVLLRRIGGVGQGGNYPAPPFLWPVAWLWRRSARSVRAGFYGRIHIVLIFRKLKNVNQMGIGGKALKFFLMRRIVIQKK